MELSMLGPRVEVASASVAPKTAATAPSMPAWVATLRPRTVITVAGGAAVHADCTQPPSAPKPAPAVPRRSALEMMPPSPPPPLAGILDCRRGAACKHSSQARRGAGFDVVCGGPPESLGCSRLGGGALPADNLAIYLSDLLSGGCRNVGRTLSGCRRSPRDTACCRAVLAGSVQARHAVGPRVRTWAW